MNLVKPSVKIESNLDDVNVLEFIEKIGRVCYKSEDKITNESSYKFIDNILDRGHESVIEHFNVTVRFIMDRGCSHELVRHRICSFSQESTRYVNYNKRGIEFIIPCWFKTIVDEGEYNYAGNENTFYTPKKIEYTKEIGADTGEYRWVLSMLNSECDYNSLISSGWQPQQARSVLPNSLKTEIVVTTNLREWRHILKLRTSKAAHPQMIEIMSKLKIELQKKIPIVFDEV